MLIQWEYFYFRETAWSLMNTLVEHGRHGWEVCGMHATVPGDATVLSVGVYLKRPKVLNHQLLPVVGEE